MSTNNRSQSLFLVSLMILASWVPLATADEGDSEQNSISNTGLFYTLDEFDPTNGKPYLFAGGEDEIIFSACLLYTSPSPRDQRGSRMPSSA